MRQAFMIGAIMLWVAINIIAGVIESKPLMSQGQDVYDSKGNELNQQELLYELQKPQITDANPVTIFTKIKDFLIFVGRAITLYHPALWQGSTIYLYYFVAAIGVSFWIVFVLSLRGVGSS